MTAGPLDAGAHAVEPGVRLELQRLAEVVLGIVQKHGHFARGLVGDGDVGQSVAIEVPVVMADGACRREP